MATLVRSGKPAQPARPRRPLPDSVGRAKERWLTMPLPILPGLQPAPGHLSAHAFARRFSRGCR